MTTEQAAREAKRLSTGKRGSASQSTQCHELSDGEDTFTNYYIIIDGTAYNSLVGFDECFDKHDIFLKEVAA